MSAIRKKNRKAFSAYKISVDDARFTYEYVKDITANFKGGAEKFYPLFYKAVSEENVFKYRIMPLKRPPGALISGIKGMPLYLE